MLFNDLYTKGLTCEQIGQLSEHIDSLCYSKQQIGTVHWNGATNSPRGIKVPPEVLKRFNDEGYTPALNATYKKK
jgi:hypothetical protein